MALPGAHRTTDGRCGSLSEVREVSSWLAKLPHRHKIVIAGNHELSFDPAFTERGEAAECGGRCGAGQRAELRAAVAGTNSQEVRRELAGCTYLQDSATTVCGIKIYGKQPLH